jgi:hypothetical protein
LVIVRTPPDVHKYVKLFFRMKLFSRDQDGPDILDALESKLDGERELLLEGEGGDDIYHEWFLTYFLRTSTSGRHYGLEIVDHGDPDVSDEETEGGEVKLAVVLEDPDTADLRRISDLLIAEYESGNGKTIQAFREFGEIMKD